MLSSVRSGGVSSSGTVDGWTGFGADLWSSRTKIVDIESDFYNAYVFAFNNPISNPQYPESRFWGFPLRCLVR